MPYGPFEDAKATCCLSISTGSRASTTRCFSPIIDPCHRLCQAARSQPDADRSASRFDRGWSHPSGPAPATHPRRDRGADACAVRCAFGAGYRRFEWKCDALNLASRRAGERLGLSFEGVFRQAGVVKGRNRDTAWFAAIDTEWPALRAAYDTWLDPANFDADGRQRVSLSVADRPGPGGTRSSARAAFLRRKQRLKSFEDFEAFSHLDYGHFPLGRVPQPLVHAACSQSTETRARRSCRIELS